MFLSESDWSSINDLGHDPGSSNVGIEPGNSVGIEPVVSAGIEPGNSAGIEPGRSTGSRWVDSIGGVGSQGKLWNIGDIESWLC